MDAPDAPAPARSAGTDWSPRAGWTVPLRRRPVPVALSCVAVAAVVAWRIGARPELPAFLWLGLAGPLLGVVDAALQRLPEPLTLPSYAAGLILLGAAAPFTDDGGGRFVHALIGMAALGGFFGVQWFFLPEGTIGFGDVVLAGLLGLYLGWLGGPAWFLGAAAAIVLAGLTALVLLATRRAGRGAALPYGPFLLVGALIAIVVHGA
ncbi:prepilin peptidase [Actinomadura rubrisoli]|uniref:Prepilin peptidase n=1 Tax=Actinomadura rubrisoli TaxID=2530368 RepID=A0A4R5BYP7_9ACTN|nr:A24 family peptidase [Actinomadura rubrisoli]TDD89564.1 prepilin peptidase [Actinomadura rubrisoli]